MSTHFYSIYGILLKRMVTSNGWNVFQVSWWRNGILRTSGTCLSKSHRQVVCILPWTNRGLQRGRHGVGWDGSGHLRTLSS